MKRLIGIVVLVIGMTTALTVAAALAECEVIGQMMERDLKEVTREQNQKSESAAPKTIQPPTKKQVGAK